MCCKFYEATSSRKVSCNSRISLTLHELFIQLTGWLEIQENRRLVASPFCLDKHRSWTRNIKHVVTGALNFLISFSNSNQGELMIRIKGLSITLHLIWKFLFSVTVCGCQNSWWWLFSMKRLKSMAAIFPRCSRMGESHGLEKENTRERSPWNTFGNPSNLDVALLLVIQFPHSIHYRDSMPKQHRCAIYPQGNSNPRNSWVPAYKPRVLLFSWAYKTDGRAKNNTAKCDVVSKDRGLISSSSISFTNPLMSHPLGLGSRTSVIRFLACSDVKKMARGGRHIQEKRQACQETNAGETSCLQKPEKIELPEWKSFRRFLFY